MLLKLLLLIGVVIGVYYLFFKKKSLPPPGDNSADETMIPCSKCNTYVQTKETLMRDGKPYCSRECMEG